MNPGPGGSPYLLAGADTGIFAFDATTDTWAPFDGGAVTNATPIRQIVFSPNVVRDGALFALGNTGLYRYNPIALQRWNRLSAVNLPLSEVLTLAVSPGFVDDQILFAITSHDIWISYDSGSTWARVRRSGLPNLDVRSLAISPDFASNRTIFVGTNGGGIFKYTFPPPAPAWLVLLYLAGDDRGVNNLSEPIDQLRGRLGDLHNRDVRVVALYDGNQPGDSRIYVRDPGTDGLQALAAPAVLPGTEWDSGSAATLQNFIRWALDTYPGSRHTMLAIVDHGGGWAPDFGNPGQSESEVAFQIGGWRGMSLDATSGSSLSTKNTGEALGQALNEGERFDVIFFDAWCVEEGCGDNTWVFGDFHGNHKDWLTRPTNPVLGSSIGSDGFEERIAAQKDGELGMVGWKKYAYFDSLSASFVPGDSTPRDQSYKGPDYAPPLP